MKKIVFATNNQHKLQEIRQIVGDDIQIVSLADIGCHDDIPETGTTLEANALQKAHYISERYGLDCFADDTGLEVDALDGAPGVYSARYAARHYGVDHCTSDDNVALLLSQLEGRDDRRAHFRTVVAYVHGGEDTLFDGAVYGTITHQRHGTDGFGYDPVFRPDGWTMTFAEGTAEAKNAISHRGRAMAKLLEYLRNEKDI